LQFADQAVHLLFPVYPVALARRAVGHPDAHAHSTDLVPAAHLVGRLLRFQIKINRVLHGGAAALYRPGWLRQNKNVMPATRRVKRDSAVALAGAAAAVIISPRTRQCTTGLASEPPA